MSTCEKTNKPLVSVVMPVYNGELYLENAINSVLNQTFANFEFIIINDGSKDNSEEIILNYTDSRIKYYKQENQGIGAALRFGCTHAKGKYIARMDADDICMVNRFEYQVGFLEKNKSYVLVSSAVIYIDENGTTLGRSYPYSSNIAIKNVLKHDSPICHPAVMMRKEAYDSAGGYLDLQPLEDWFLWTRIFLFGRLKNITTPLLKYRIHTLSITSGISDNDRSSLRKYLFEKSRNEFLSNKEINEFQLMYKEFQQNKKNNDIAKNKNESLVINKKGELYMQSLLSFFKVSEVHSEKIISYVKSVYSIRCF